MWTNDAVLRLIDLYRSHEYLWDPYNDGYKNKALKFEAWERIAQLMGMPRREVEMKMHSVRSQFSRERKRMKSPANPNNIVRQSTWFAFNALMFLVKDDADSSGNVTPVMKYDMYQDSQSNDYEEESNHVAVTLTETDQNNIQYEQETQSQNRPSNSRKRPYENAPSNSYTPPVETENKLDDFEIYGQYVASELRSVKTERGMLMAKYFINKIVLDARMGKYDEEVQEYNPGDDYKSYAGDGMTKTNHIKVEAPSGNSIRDGNTVHDLVVQMKSEPVENF